MYEEFTKIIDEKAREFTGLSDRIWDRPETAFVEYDSVRRLCDTLRREGFEVKEKEAGIDTAFSAKYGSGRPVIGLLGEFDALSGLSQEAGATEHCPVEKGGNGHGCGHNLLGTASLAAAVAVKEYLESAKVNGTVIYFGCPGEEGGSGKAFMARDGVFDDLDLAITWHPGDSNVVASGSTLANIQVSYKFKGVAAHASRVPYLGRSALDAVELMNVGVNYLREHVIPEARMHYAVTNTGGFSPNVVQREAEVLYLLRAPQNSQARDIYRRVTNIAKGAALMTETAVEVDFVKACSNVIPNTVLESLLDKKLRETPRPVYTEEELEFARKLQSTMPKNISAAQKYAKRVSDRDLKQKLLEQEGKPIYDMVFPYIPDDTPMPGSSDVGDVSWICPTAQLSTACWAAGTPGHSWQVVAQGKSSIAHKGLIYAAKAMAAAVIQLYTDKETVRRARDEWKERVGDGYVCPIPKEVKPRSIAPKK